MSVQRSMIGTVVALSACVALAGCALLPRSPEADMFARLELPDGVRRTAESTGYNDGSGGLVRWYLGEPGALDESEDLRIPPSLRPSGTLSGDLIGRWESAAAADEPGCVVELLRGGEDDKEERAPFLDLTQEELERWQEGTVAVWAIFVECRDA
jgi:hypothetical protein